MRYLLDSDIVSDLYDKSADDHEKISTRLGSVEDSDDVCISILTLYELEYGLANAPEEKQDVVAAKIAEAQRDFGVLPLSVAGAQHFGALKKSLKDHRSLTQAGIKKHNIDLMIAATALAENCTLVSADAVYADLRKSHAELQVEDWVAPPPESAKT